MYVCIVCVHVHDLINEPQLRWLQTTTYHMAWMKVTQCAGRVPANTRRHQLCWSDREWAYYMSCTRVHVHVDVCTCT